MKENDIFSASTQILEYRAQYLRNMYVDGKHQGHRIVFPAFYNFVLVETNNDFAEILGPSHS